MHKFEITRTEAQNRISTGFITYITWILLLNISHNCSLTRQYFKTYLQKEKTYLKQRFYFSII